MRRCAGGGAPHRVRRCARHRVRRALSGPAAGHVRGTRPRPATPSPPRRPRRVVRLSPRPRRLPRISCSVIAQSYVTRNSEGIHDGRSTRAPGPGERRPCPEGRPEVRLAPRPAPLVGTTRPAHHPEP
ncbi:hypothetical protein SBD_5183 [Streptomyces bottropensis ATCC 25435]|uniref:Uncharacterized protein n=1 Tax=Streptomyces bottropensis ATCC 25435 TaxID=1054862 RepID=M3DBC8_9ACTN|nr:hypothetical protein SBD_5183 [Streptomyces bottropensis ATCC 25435]